MIAKIPTMTNNKRILFKDLQFFHIVYIYKIEPVKRKPGRPKGSKNYATLEERKDAVRQSKSKYMAKKTWYCVAWSRVYFLAGKFYHCRSQKHLQNRTIACLYEMVDEHCIKMITNWIVTQKASDKLIISLRILDDLRSFKICYLFS